MKKSRKDEGDEEKLVMFLSGMDGIGKSEAIKAFIAKKEAWTEEQNKIQAVLKVKKHEFVQSLGMYTHLKKISFLKK